MRRGPRRRRSRHRTPFDRPTEVHESDGVCALIQTRSPPPIASHQYLVAPPGLVVRDESLIRTRRVNHIWLSAATDFCCSLLIGSPSSDASHRAEWKNIPSVCLV